jgi:3-(3-hydroxy-phenyl)propionate hydroxylase
VKMIRLAKLMGQLIMPRSHPRALIVHGALALLRRLSVVREFFDELGVKPQNAFTDGLFVRGGDVARRGAWLPQGLIRSPSGSVQLSDDVLGPGPALVGLGVDPCAYLSDDNRDRWVGVGGRTVHLSPRGRSLSATDASSYEDLEGRLVPGAAPYGSCVVVRPDRAVLHDGPIEDADRLVQESLECLWSGKQGAQVTRNVDARRRAAQ